MTRQLSFLLLWIQWVQVRFIETKTIVCIFCGKKKQKTLFLKRAGMHGAITKFLIVYQYEKVGNVRINWSLELIV